MFETAIIFLFISAFLLVARVYLGPSLYDRVLAVNSFGSVAVLIIAVVGFLNGRPDFLDIALLYALINFIGTIAILNFFRYKMIDPESADPSNNETAHE